ncbi:MAG TPA: hypothetical protein VFN56_01145 [Candidatus Saccharimonadales bacterium]|nr:hypothetical protein [Candidatus Saccharimonadales bacterium]
MDDEHVMDPAENPLSSGHLPVSGEVGNGPVAYHDPVTQPTDDERSDTVERTDEATPETSPQE